MSTIYPEVKTEDEDVDEEIISDAAASHMAPYVQPEVEIALEHEPPVKKEDIDMKEGIFPSYAGASDMACSTEPEVKLSPDLKPTGAVAASEHRGQFARGNRITRRERRVCYRCNKRGHLARNCRNSPAPRRQGELVHYVANGPARTQNHHGSQVLGNNLTVSMHGGHANITMYGSGTVHVNVSGNSVNINIGPNCSVHAYISMSGSYNNRLSLGYSNEHL